MRVLGVTICVVIAVLIGTVHSNKRLIRRWRRVPTSTTSTPATTRSYVYPWFVNRTASPTPKTAKYPWYTRKPYPTTTKTPFWWRFTRTTTTSDPLPSTDNWWNRGRTQKSTTTFWDLWDATTMTPTMTTSTPATTRSYLYPWFVNRTASPTTKTTKYPWYTRKPYATTTKTPFWWRFTRTTTTSDPLPSTDNWWNRGRTQKSTTTFWDRWINQKTTPGSWERPYLYDSNNNWENHLTTRGLSDLWKPKTTTEFWDNWDAPTMKLDFGNLNKQIDNSIDNTDYDYDNGYSYHRYYIGGSVGGCVFIIVIVVFLRIWIIRRRVTRCVTVIRRPGPLQVLSVSSLPTSRNPNDDTARLLQTPPRY